MQMRISCVFDRFLGKKARVYKCCPAISIHSCVRTSKKSPLIIHVIGVNRTKKDAQPEENPRMFLSSITDKEKSRAVYPSPRCCSHGNKYRRVKLWISCAAICIKKRDKNQSFSIKYLDALGRLLLILHTLLLEMP